MHHFVLTLYRYRRCGMTPYASKWQSHVAMLFYPRTKHNIMLHPMSLNLPILLTVLGTV